MLVNLIKPELRSIEHAIAENKIDRDASGRRQEPPVDPCPDMIRALACFLNWYMKAQLLLFPVKMAPDLQRSVKVWKEVARKSFGANQVRKRFAISPKCTLLITKGLR